MGATLTGYLPGDILFYAKLGSSDLVGTVIEDWTDSEFDHVAIAVSAIQKIESLGLGVTPGGAVVLTPIEENRIAGAFHYSQHAHPFDPDDLAMALGWLHSQVGQLYGWGDIANAFLAKFEHGFSIDVGEHFDCSALATEFLLKAGGIDFGAITNAHEVTPAILAGVLGVKAGQL